MRTIDVAPLPLSELESHLDEVAAHRLRDGVAAAQALLEGRVLWTVTPTDQAGAGPVETVAPLVGYARGLGVDARWLCLDAPAEFAALSGRLHSWIHGDIGDRGRLGDKERDLYEHTLASNAENVAGDIREGDIVILHDPATAGLARALKAAGAVVIWRCHAGADLATASPEGVEDAQRAWAFLDRYLEDADYVIVSCEEYRPPFTEPEGCAVIPPSINPDSPKNRVLDMDEAWSIARLAGIFDGAPPFDAFPFIRGDGRTAALRATAAEGCQGGVMRVGGPVPLGARTITQVSRWDRLKGMKELAIAFAENLGALPEDAHLLLVGPCPEENTTAARVLDEVVDAVELLPAAARSRIHVAAVPAQDREINALVVNAAQRVSSVVTQRSIVEAFGLTVAEAMWKKAPVVASGVGGIRTQVTDGVDGVLVDPHDGAAWAQAVADLLLFPERAAEMGATAHESVRRSFLPDRHLLEVLDALAAALERS
ncbi:glycosyltransferase [Actinomyces timonensis]|uniref:glycosyltransferase n=1 Tax=Actinomyces timonensis TaxID=1288391 RepID=UPI00030D3CB1|nr:glycosyltransferase [Actinomyces timonensis]